ncbi:SctK family type III secretion system sorting platform protein [uncultured Hydrogenophaga sp.]|uniref:SctK family type III secretion system sorting platform protein n=1 Tax=uncultured Hydrogenophaga sp. TaxID=199683 RepID=UPI00258E5C3B|nr:SctK family type III secretion system sorting platform protein [uncultured Hydrogenophaga sp.]
MSLASPLTRWPASRGLLSVVAHFDASPAEYMRGDRVDALFGPAVAERLWRSERARRHLSRAVRRQLDEDCDCLDLDRPEWRLALLPVARLDRLASHVAGLVVAAEVRRALSREEVRLWRDWLEPEAYEFAQTVTGLMPVLMPLPAPQAWRRFTAAEVGWCWMAKVAGEWPVPMRSRFALKQPALADGCVCPQDAAGARRLVQAVLSIVESRWCSSFATVTS